jgi:outer membrane protein
MTIKKLRVLFISFVWMIVMIPFRANQALAENLPDSVRSDFNLIRCIDYALKNQPILNQTRLDELITNKNIQIALSGVLPQLSINANMQHYLQLPVLIFPDFSNPTGPKRKITTGVLNTSAMQLSATQNIYNTQLLFAGRTAPDYRRLSGENTERFKIDVVVNVSRAFYDVLLTEQQIKVLSEDVQRQQVNTKDAFDLYTSGLADKTDYKRATISLNNARSAKKSVEENVKGKYALLKQLIGFPPDSTFTVSFDSTNVAKEINIDTLQAPDLENRIEYQSLQTSLRLQNSQIEYYKWSFLPTLSAFYNYNLIYQTDLFSELYNNKYPNSYVGLTLNLPVFQGGKRLQNVSISRLQYKQKELEIENLKNQINTEYTQALAIYKSNRNQMNINLENVKNAREIYSIIKLQYNQGIKTYLDVIVAESDLRSAELNYLDTLFQVLSSALEVKKALGIISIQ